MNEIVIDRDVFDVIYRVALERESYRGLSNFSQGWDAGYLAALERILSLSDGE